MQLSNKDQVFRDFQMKKFSVKKMVPTVTMTKHIDAQSLLNTKHLLNVQYHDIKITLSHIIIKAVADTIVHFPLLFSYFHKGQAVTNSKLVLNIPVDIDNHVEYIVIHSPETKSICDIAQECNNEIEQIKNHTGTFWEIFQEIARHPAQLIGKKFIKLVQEHYGNFVISNFGSFQIDSGSLALSGPMTAGICIGMLTSVLQKEEEQFQEIKRIPMTLSFDHRVIDGGYAGRFMNSLQEKCENNKPFVHDSDKEMASCEEKHTKRNAVTSGKP